MFGFTLSARDVDAKQYHLASFSTRNSTLNTTLRKPIRMQDFVQLCDSIENLYFSNNILEHSISFLFQPGLPEMCLCQQGLTCTPVVNGSAAHQCLKIPESAREQEE